MSFNSRLSLLQSFYATFNLAVNFCFAAAMNFILLQVIGKRDLMDINFKELIGYAFSLGFFISSIGLPCYFAHELEINSSNFVDDVGGSDWIDAGESYKKMMAIFIANLRPPMQLRALGFAKINLEFFMTVRSDSCVLLLINISLFTDYGLDLCFVQLSTQYPSLMFWRKALRALPCAASECGLKIVLNY